MGEKSGGSADLEKLLKLARGIGAEECEIFCMRSEGSAISSVGKILKSKEADVREGYGVRVLAGGRLGFASFDDVGDAKREIANARKLAKFSPKLGDFSFAGKQRYARVGAFDGKVAALGEGEAKGIALALLGGVERYAKPTECGIEYGVSECAIANSEGLLCRERRTGMSAFAQANCRGSSSHESCSGIGLLDEEGARELGERAGRIAGEMRGAKKIGKAERTVVFETEALASLFESMLVPNLNGDRARRKITRLCGEEGREVAAAGLSIWDDPFAEGADRGAFDGEGVASRRLPLIERGVFKNFLFDRRTAALAALAGKGEGAKRSLRREGNCGRGDFSAQPGITASNTVVAPGRVKNFEDELGCFLLVRDFHGQHTANTITGDFSVALDVAWEVEGGGRKPVRGNLLSGNIFGLLKKIEGIERGRKVYGDFISPRMAFGDVWVVG